MKQRKPAFYALFILLLIINSTGCKKSDSNTTPKPPEPAVTETGTPDGTPVTKNIGSAGGTIVSADGMLELVIPAGALSANTDITIQPITNKAPGGRHKAYRCLPDGQTFANNITIKFHYTPEDLAATKKEFMGIAFQNKDRFWQMIPGATNDTTNKKISVPVNHFTDFTSFDVFRIYPVDLFLKTNETGIFTIDGGMTSVTQTETLLALIGQSPVIWRVNGKEGGDNTVGRIQPVAAQLGTANYTAPATAPASGEFTISAEISGTFVIDGQSFNKLVLVATVHIIGKKYKVTMEYELTSMHSQDKWKLKDHGSYTVNLTGNTGIVSDISNPDAILEQISGNCTSLRYGGFGPINIRSIDFTDVIAIPGGLVYVAFNDSRTVQYPIFNVSAACTGSVPGTIDMGIQPAMAGSIQFTDNGQPQIIDGSAGGIKLVSTIIPIP
jgi:hypothetical protein